MKYDPNDYKKDRKPGGGGGNYLPVGKHIVRVTDHEMDETSSGLAQVVVTFEARDGRSRKAWLIAEGKAGFQIGMLFEACEQTQAIDLDDDRAFRQAFYNKDIEIVVKDETYQGETNPRVKWINKAPGGAGSGVTPRQERREEPRTGGYGGGSGGYGGGGYGRPTGGGYGGGGTAPRDDIPPYTPDDDIPF